MFKFNAISAVTCPRCGTTHAAGSTVRMVPTPRGNKPGCLDCTGARQPAPRTTRYERQEGEEASHERRCQSVLEGKW